MAGHSLGEYSALVAAGSLKFADAVQLVRKRGRYMQEAVPAGVGAMAAILKLPEGRLEGVLAQAAQDEVVSAANLNSPDQVVIAGHAGAVNRAVELAKAAGARRAVLLPVSAPFHCVLMTPAQDRLKADLDATDFRDIEVARSSITGVPWRYVRAPTRARGCMNKFPTRCAGWKSSSGWRPWEWNASLRSGRAACLWDCSGISIRRWQASVSARRPIWTNSPDSSLFLRFDGVQDLRDHRLRGELEEPLGIIFQ